jgi:hypothetical protein
VDWAHAQRGVDLSNAGADLEARDGRRPGRQVGVAHRVVAHLHASGGHRLHLLMDLVHQMPEIWYMISLVSI